MSSSTSWKGTWCWNTSRLTVSGERNTSGRETCFLCPLIRLTLRSGRRIPWDWLSRDLGGRKIPKAMPGTVRSAMKSSSNCPGVKAISFRICEGYRRNSTPVRPCARVRRVAMYSPSPRDRVCSFVSAHSSKFYMKNVLENLTFTRKNQRHVDNVDDIRGYGNQVPSLIRESLIFRKYK